MADPLLEYNAYFANLLAPVRAYGDRKVAIAEADKIFRQRQQFQRDAFQQQQDLEEKRLQRFLDVENIRQEGETKREIAREARQLALERQREEFKQESEVRKSVLELGISPNNPDGSKKSVHQMMTEKDDAMEVLATTAYDRLQKAESAIANLKIRNPATSAVAREAIQNLANNGAVLDKLKPKNRARLISLAAARGDAISNVTDAIGRGWFSGDDADDIMSAYNKEVAEIRSTATDNAKLQAAAQLESITRQITPLAQSYAKHLGGLSPVRQANFLSKQGTAPLATTSPLDAFEVAKAAITGGAAETTPPPGTVQPATLAPMPATAPTPRPEAVLGAQLLAPPASLGQWRPVRAPVAAPAPVGVSNTAGFLGGGQSPMPFTFPQAQIRPIPGMGPSSSSALRAGIPEADLQQMQATALATGEVTPQQVSAFTERLNAGDPDAIAHLRELHAEFLKGRAQNVLQQQPRYPRSGGF